VRVIVATNRDLQEEVRAGNFREDLFFRLHVVPLTLPPLRERPEDIPLLAEHYLRFFRRRQGSQRLAFSDQANSAMLRHHWPGNFRELRNVVERAVILSPGERIEPQDLSLPVTGNLGDSGGDGNVNPDKEMPKVGGPYSMEQLEREHIARLLATGASAVETAAGIGNRSEYAAAQTKAIRLDLSSEEGLSTQAGLGTFDQRIPEPRATRNLNHGFPNDHPENARTPSGTFDCRRAASSVSVGWLPFHAGDPRLRRMGCIDLVEHERGDGRRSTPSRQ
jgi:hypothetical protein